VAGLNGVKLDEFRSVDAFRWGSMWVTPCWYNPQDRMELVKECLDFVAKFPKWRVGIQAHKYWGGVMSEGLIGVRVKLIRPYTWANLSTEVSGVGVIVHVGEVAERVGNLRVPVVVRMDEGRLYTVCVDDLKVVEEKVAEVSATGWASAPPSYYEGRK
jgi:hypothetical protein